MMPWRTQAGLDRAGSFEKSAGSPARAAATASCARASAIASILAEAGSARTSRHTAVHMTRTPTVPSSWNIPSRLRATSLNTYAPWIAAVEQVRCQRRVSGVLVVWSPALVVPRSCGALAERRTKEHGPVAAEALQTPLFNPAATMQVVQFDDRHFCFVVDDALLNPDELVQFAAERRAEFNSVDFSYYPGIYRMAPAMRALFQPLFLLLLTTSLATGMGTSPPRVDGGSVSGGSLLDPPPQDEIIYFLLPDRFENGEPSNDRGGLSGGRLATGFDPSDKAFYHGGDLKGLISRLEYIQELGATAVWVAPVFRNKPVQGAKGRESAGYHGYWITDFTRVDPHLGTNDDFRALTDAVHARGMKLYLDIVVNHTADVIAYRECPMSSCPYRSHAEFPYQRRGGLGGEPINSGFLGDDAPHQIAG